MAGTEFEFSTISEEGGGGGTTIFARVRARVTNGNVGQFSAVLNTSTGQAETGDIADEAVTDDKVSTVEPVQVTGLLLPGAINGLTLSNNATDPDNDIDIATGFATDDTDAFSMTNSSTITKRLDATWTAGSGNGGRASATSLTADTPYFVFFLSDENNELVDAGFDTDPLGSNLVADVGASFGFKRRVGCVVTGSGSTILPFNQYGDFFQLNDPIQDVVLAAIGTSERTHQLVHVPVGIRHVVHCSINWRPNDPSNWTGFVQYGSGDSDFSGSVPDATDNDGGSQADARVVHHSATILVPPSGQIKTRQSASTGTLRLYVQIHGWDDFRGKDGTV